LRASDNDDGKINVGIESFGFQSDGLWKIAGDNLPNVMEGVNEAQSLARVLRVGAAADGQFWIDLRGRGGRFQVV
jgi:hypothetical protein